MECKKDEAIRAKEVAEKEMKEKNFGGALAHALEAKNLFPGLDGVTQLVEVLSILAVTEKKVKGEVNWYAVLDVNPLAGEGKLEEHYRLLAFSLHPDNNKSIGADKALEVVYEAWKLLSNTDERTKYDKMFGQWKYIDMMKPPVPTGCNAYPLWTFSPNETVPYCLFAFDNFLTTCDHCKTQYIYEMQYCSKAVFCSTCREPFFAIDSSSSSRSSSKQHPAASSSGANIGFSDEPKKADASASTTTLEEDKDTNDSQEKVEAAASIK